MDRSAGENRNARRGYSEHCRRLAALRKFCFAMHQYGAAMHFDPAQTTRENAAFMPQRSAKDAARHSQE
jgi:hypothetical protein